MADSPAWAFSGTGRDGLHPARFARAPGPDQRGGHGVVLRAAGHGFTFAGATVIFGSGEGPVRE
ncbi:MAG TPA: hypothetical protein VGJ54_06020 [Streptosporangiaceae bacterium]